MITTRRARPDEAAALRALAARAYAPYTERLGRTAPPVDADYAGAVAAGTAWVAEADGVIAGYAILVDEGDHLLLDNVAVDPDGQGRGVGAVLLRLAEDEARRLALPEIRLYTNEAMTENLRYYARHGYAETHRAGEHPLRRVFFTKVLDPDHGRG